MGGLPRLLADYGPASEVQKEIAGYRERVARDASGKIEQHFVILPFAARLIAGEPLLNEELAEVRWLAPAELAGLPTTEGLAEIVATAIALVEG